jgi:ABC-2 type transport system permease protein
VFKDVKLIVLILVFPLVAIVFFSSFLSEYLDKSSFIDPFDIAVVDKESSNKTDLLIKQLRDIATFKKVMIIKEYEKEKYIKSNTVSAVIIIPGDFSDSLINGVNHSVEVIGNTNKPLESYITKNIVASAANLVSASQAGINTIYYFNKKTGMDYNRLSKEVNESSVDFIFRCISRNDVFVSDSKILYNVNPVEYFTATLMVVFFMFSGLPGAKMFVEEKYTGMIDRLQIQGISPINIILSKFIVSFILSIMQFVSIIAFTTIAFKNYWGISILNAAILFVAIIFAVSAWGIFVAVVSKKSSTASIISNLGILLMAILGGSIYPLSQMPYIIRSFSDFTINKWAVEGFLKIFSGESVNIMSENIVALCLIGVAFLIVSIPIYMIEIKSNR